MPAAVDANIHEIRLSLDDLIEPSKVRLIERYIDSCGAREVAGDLGAEPAPQTAVGGSERVAGPNMQSEVLERPIGHTATARGARHREWAGVGRDRRAVPAEPRGGIPQRRGEQVCRVKCPVPVPVTPVIYLSCGGAGRQRLRLRAGVSTLAAERLFIHGDVVPMPRQEMALRAVSSQKEEKTQTAPRTTKWIWKVRWICTP